MTEKTSDQNDEAESTPSLSPGKKKKVGQKTAKKERLGSTSGAKNKVNSGCHYELCAYIRGRR